MEKVIGLKIKILWMILITLSLNYLLIFSSTLVYASEEEKNVLFISSYTENFETVPYQINGIQSVFQPHNINLDIEYMDTKRFDTDENKGNFYRLLQYKFKKLQTYDVIIVGDDNALEFITTYKEELFNGIPIVFLGINDLNRAIKASKDTNITGVIEGFSLAETIEVAQKFNNNATKVVAIVDDTLTGKGDKEQFYQLENDFKTLSFMEINTSDYTFDELKNIFKKIENDTILLYLSMFQDKTGSTISINEAVKILSKNTNVPVYRASIGGVGEGLLGGKMVSYDEQGIVAANMALQVLTGTPINSIEMVTESPNKYIFDFKIIEKYNINKKMIPEDAVLINKKLSFYSQNKKIVWVTLLIIGFLLILILIIMRDNIKRRIIEKRLKESHEELEATYEELLASEEELGSQCKIIQGHVDEITILNQKYEIAINSTSSAVWEYDLDSEKIFVSKEFNEVFNKNINETRNIHSVLDQLFNSEGKEKLFDEYRLYNKGEKDEISLQVQIEDNESLIKWILIKGKGVFDHAGLLIKLAGIILDITKMKEQEAYIEYLAYHDFLTTLPNRISFMNKISEEIVTGRHGAIILLDLDNFKSINDTLGHDFGDMVLKEISRRLFTLVNEKVFVSRFGGDEFLILICGEKNNKDIDSYAEQITELFTDAFDMKGNKRYIHFSMGISQFPKDSIEVEELIMYADTAMYKVKNSGKNNYMFFKNNMIEKLKESVKIEHILVDALKTDGFTLVYQPQVQTMTGKINGFEALIRLKEHKISPGQFIPIAEEAGLIIEIGRWVTRVAIEQIAMWKEKGFKLKPIAINLSSKQLSDVNYHDFLKSLLIKNGVDARYLEIEITESILLEESNDTMKFLSKIKEIGIKISLDDFGTGYSSFNYLTFLPLDKIKLDKSLIDKFLQIDKIQIMDNIISLAHSLNLEITAEGVEEFEQYRKLKVGGCDYIQGYLFSKPLAAEEIEKIYDANLLEKIRIERSKQE